MPSGGELLIILLAVFILFGGKGLREFARTAGKWTRKIQNASRDFQRELNLDEFRREFEDEPLRPVPRPSYRPETPPGDSLAKPDDPGKKNDPGKSDLQG